MFLGYYVQGSIDLDDEKYGGDGEMKGDDGVRIDWGSVLSPHHSACLLYSLQVNLVIRTFDCL